MNINSCSLATLIILLLPIRIATATLLVSENFGGSIVDDLNGTSADTFNPLVTGAGGSAVWTARVGYYFADGTVGYNSNNSAAFLDMGSYINGSKGNDNAIFTLQSTIIFTDNISTGDDQNTDRITMGFFRSSMTTDETFFTNSRGALTFNFRGADGGTDPDVYIGYGTTNPQNVGTYGRGVGAASHKFTTILDLATWNGSSDFGSVSFYLDDVQLGSTFPIGSDLDYRFIGFTENNNGNGKLAAFTFSQIPEPGSLTLTLLGLTCGLVTLRHRYPNRRF